MACGKHTVYNYSDMLWSHYRPYWRQLRKLWVTELLSARQLRLTERVRAEEKYVGEDGAGPGAAATPEEFRWMIEEIFLNGALHVGDMVSWLGWLDAHGYVGRMKRLAAKFDRFIEHVLREHGERQQREGGAFVPGDMVDLLLYLYLAGGTLQYGARNLVSIDNPVTPPPPAPVSGPPIGPGFVRPPPPPQEV
ncbi:hypothetical protein ZEAMMB73_Zm00001d008699 [Zea mays]|uniref:Uncharacterized protein n=1 Tax=Zea mays TaxID=4577 RepID=A0A1D6FES6_MAIZE|nr:hypothetical protein ZEAMMB73_Zm00001d008699 [Zea mays]